MKKILLFIALSTLGIISSSSAHVYWHVPPTFAFVDTDRTGNVSSYDYLFVKPVGTGFSTASRCQVYVNGEPFVALTLSDLRSMDVLRDGIVDSYQLNRDGVFFYEPGPQILKNVGLDTSVDFRSPNGPEPAELNQPFRQMPVSIGSC